MQKFEKTLHFNNEIKFKLDGDFIVNFIESIDENDYIKVNHNFNSDQIEIDATEDNVTIVDKCKTTVDNNDFENFKNSIAANNGVVSAVANFMIDALRFKSRVESSKREIVLEVYLRKVEPKKSIYLNAGNLKIDFNRIECNDVLISAGNLTINQGGLTSNTLRINSGNLKADIFFNERNRKINIKSSNAKVRLNKQPNFNGLITTSGNNIKVDDAIRSGTKDFGEFNAKLNNGTIKLVAI